MVRQDGNRAKLLKLLNSNKFLSPSFASWYYRILIDKAEELHIPLGELIKNFNLSNHPHELILNMCIDKGCGKVFAKLSSSENSIKTDSPHLLSKLKTICHREFRDQFHELPPISTGSLFLDKGTSPKLLFLDSGIAYVVVDISGKDDYYDNYKTMKDLINKYFLKGKTINVIENVALVKNGKNKYFISEFKGLDYESEIIEYGNFDLATELFEIAKGLEAYFGSQGYFFRDLAPRNLIHSKDRTTFLIDFENLSHIDHSNLLERFTNILPRRVWFSDILNDREIDDILGNIALSDKDQILINSDSFDYQFYNKKVISLEEREIIYKIVGCWERKDNYQGIMVYGHLLGRFISDFWKEESEASLLKFIQANPAQIAKLRAVLYLLSRLDQELLLRKKYGLNVDLDLLSEAYFKEVLFTNNIVIEPNDLDILLKGNTGFNEGYELIKHVLNNKRFLREHKKRGFVNL